VLKGQGRIPPPPPLKVFYYLFPIVDVLLCRGPSLPPVERIHAVKLPRPLLVRAELFFLFSYTPLFISPPPVKPVFFGQAFQFSLILPRPAHSCRGSPAVPRADLVDYQDRQVSFAMGFRQAVFPFSASAPPFPTPAADFFSPCNRCGTPGLLLGTTPYCYDASHYIVLSTAVSCMTLRLRSWVIVFRRPSPPCTILFFFLSFLSLLPPCPLVPSRSLSAPPSKKNRAPLPSVLFTPTHTPWQCLPHNSPSAAIEQITPLFPFPDPITQFFTPAHSFLPPRAHRWAC